jgi:drug/metabolite transporter (DMT)-like permease
MIPRFTSEDPVTLALAAAGLFGAALVLTQFGLQHMSPRRGALVSIPTSTALFWLLAPFMLRGSEANASAVAIFLAVGLLFPASVTLLTFEANRRMGPSVAGALGNLTPLFAVGLAVLLFNEVPRPQHAVGIGVILAGVAILSVDRAWGGGRWPVWVMALPLAAAAIRGATQPIAKFGLALWPSPFAAALLGYTASSMVVAGAAFLRPSDRTPDRVGKGLLWFAIVGLCNGGAVLALYAALQRGPVTLVSPLVATYPLFTLVLTPMLFRETRLERRRVAGVVVTVAGVVVLLSA